MYKLHVQENFGPLSYGLKSPWPVISLDYLFKFLNPNCMFRKILVLMLHLTPSCCLKGQKLCCIYLFYIIYIYIHFIYLNIFYYIVFSSLWCYKGSVLSYIDNQKFLIGFDFCKVHETSNSSQIRNQ